MLRLSYVSLLLLVAGSEAFYSKSGPVQMLDGMSFDREVLSSNHTSIVEFFAPWCGHCKTLKPAYEKAAKSLKGLAKVVAIDCNEEYNKPFCSAQGVQGFPTLKVYKPSTKGGKAVAEDYQQARTAKAIVDYVIERIPNKVERVTDTSLESFLSKENSTLAKGILFTTKGTTGAMYKALAIDFQGAALFAQVRDNQKLAADIFGVQTFPRFLVIPTGGSEAAVYDGDFKKDAMYEWMSKLVTPTDGPAAPKPKSETKQKNSKASTKPTKSGGSSEPAEATTEASNGSKDKVVEPEFDWAPTKIDDVPKLITTCFAAKTKTCILAMTQDSSELHTIQLLKDVNAKMHSRLRGDRRIMTFATIPRSSTLGKKIGSLLGPDGTDNEPMIVAVNGAKAWYIKYSGAAEKNPLGAWLDDVKMGQIKKLKLPKALQAFEMPEEAKTATTEASQMPEPSHVEENPPPDAEAGEEATMPTESAPSAAADATARPEDTHDEL